VAGSASVTGTLNGSSIGNATAVDFVPGPPSGSTSSMSRSAKKITANGVASATITVRAFDVFENIIKVGGATVVLNTTLGNLSTVTDHNNGLYTATLTSTVAGTGVVSGTINGDPITVTTSVDFVPGPPSGAATVMSRSARTIPADGVSTATVTVVAKDQYGNELKVGGATVVLSTTRGSLGTVTDLGNGRYKVTLTSSLTPGNADITGTINGETIGHPTSIRFT
jgi:adhesin/invasin